MRHLEPYGTDDESLELLSRRLQLVTLDGPYEEACDQQRAHEHEDATTSLTSMRVGPRVSSPHRRHAAAYVGADVLHIALTLTIAISLPIVYGNNNQWSSVACSVLSLTVIGSTLRRCTTAVRVLARCVHSSLQMTTAAESIHARKLRKYAYVAPDVIRMERAAHVRWRRALYALGTLLVRVLIADVCARMIGDFVERISALQVAQAVVAFADR